MSHTAGSLHGQSPGRQRMTSAARCNIYDMMADDTLRFSAVISLKNIYSRCLTVVNLAPKTPEVSSKDESIE